MVIKAGHTGAGRRNDATLCCAVRRCQERRFIIQAIVEGVAENSLTYFGLYDTFSQIVKPSGTVRVPV